MAKKRESPSVLATFKDTSSPAPPKKLLADLRKLIQDARTGVAQAVNASLVLLYWRVGNRLRTDVLRNKRAEYGEQILPTLSAKLIPECGQGFSERNWPGIG
jgi:hypothetical protein